MKSGIDKLIKELTNNELQKVTKINPEKYYIFTSLPLSPHNKKSIYNIFSFWMDNEWYIFGKDDINALIDKYPKIEEIHFKLWYSSSNVMRNILNRASKIKSKYIIERALETQMVYVYTENHKNALSKLEALHTIIITGEPGIGKSTLAEQICLHYFNNKFEFISIADSIDEVYDVYDPDIKQIFYFDDFLGSNFLTALERNEDSKIMRFINQIRCNNNSRFILTSRTSILNQGLILGNKFIIGNIQKNEYILNADSVTYLDKAKILYNRIWQTNLHPSYIEEIYKEKKYLKIIKHKNYNPGIIEFFTDINKLDEVPADKYWKYIETSLNNPADVWGHPFNVQLSPLERGLILLIAYNGPGGITEENLITAFNIFISINGIGNFDTNIYNSLKIITKSFAIRYIAGGIVSYKLANPSIGDYVFTRHNNENIIKLIINSLQSTSALALMVTVRNDLVPFGYFALDLLDHARNRGVQINNIMYAIQLLYYCIIDDVDISIYDMDIADLFVGCNLINITIDYYFFNVLNYIHTRHEFGDEWFESLFEHVSSLSFDKDDMKAFIEFYNNNDNIQSANRDQIVDDIILEYFNENFDEIIDSSDVMSNVNFVPISNGDDDFDWDYDYDEIESAIIAVINSELSDLNINIPATRVVGVKAVDRLIDRELQCRSSLPCEEQQFSYNKDIDIDSINDLFDRG